MFFFRKIHWAPSEILKVKKPFSRSRRPNFGFHLVFMDFHLEFSLFWVSLEGAQRIFSKNIFLKSVRSNEKDVESFLVELFTKSLHRHRGGVDGIKLKISSTAKRILERLGIQTSSSFVCIPEFKANFLIFSFIWLVFLSRNYWCWYFPT